MIRVSVLGASGYAGIELVRLLVNHPHAKLVHLVSPSSAGESVEKMYPHFMGSGLQFEAMDLNKAALDSDIVFTSLPHGASGATVSALYEAGAKIIDLSGEFRYKDAAVYEKWYQSVHPVPALLKEAVYGLPELHREEIKKTRLVGNPGCYTTCSILPLAPLLKEGLIDPDSMIIDAKSGTSGAGKTPNAATHFCEVDESVKAYNVAKHRHTSEIEQELSLAANRPVALSFTPHLLPIKRGILSTIYCTFTGGSAGQVKKAYEDAYGSEPFIRLYAEGLPEIKHIAGSNVCGIGFVLDERVNRLVIVSVLDNLIKGAAGQAIQNMNIMFGLDEKTGLNSLAWYL
ncbi:MAG: N-acetyl-gamma-glutamyl-phosphate reductase [Christensenellales bacterium]